MSYYAFIEDLKCLYCNKEKLIQLSADVTCSACGAEQNLGNFVHQAPRNYSDTEANFSSAPRPIEEKPKKRVTIPDDIFILYEQTVQQNVIDSARNLYLKYALKSVIRKDNIHSLVMACIYFASKAFTPIRQNVLLKAMPGVEESKLNLAIQSVNRVLSDSAEFNALLSAGVHLQLTHDINTSLQVLKDCIPSEHHNSIRSMAYKLADKFSNAVTVKVKFNSMTPTTRAISLIYAACSIQKLGIRLPAICKAASITQQTVLTALQVFKDCKSSSS